MNLRVHVYMCICVQVNLYVCFLHMAIWLHVYVYVHMYLHVYRCIYARVYVFGRPFACVYVSILTRVNTCTSIQHSKVRNEPTELSLGTH